jgi:hypothetical protein
VLHTESTACAIVRRAGAGVVLDFDGEAGIEKINEYLLESFKAFKNFSDSYQYEAVKQEELEKFSAVSVTGILATALNEIVT